MSDPIAEVLIGQIKQWQKQLDLIRNGRSLDEPLEGFPTTEQYLHVLIANAQAEQR